MKKRSFLFFLISVFFSNKIFSHTPYRQWKVLRQKSLLVHSTRTNPKGDFLAEEFVKILNKYLPEAKSRVARTKHEKRLASLLTTRQAAIGIMEINDAISLFKNKGNFTEFNGSKLRILLKSSDQLVLALDTFSSHHAWLITSIIIENSKEFDFRIPTQIDKIPIPLHDGTLAYFNGEFFD